MILIFCSLKVLVLTSLNASVIHLSELAANDRGFGHIGAILKGSRTISISLPWWRGGGSGEQSVPVKGLWNDLISENTSDELLFCNFSDTCKPNSDSGTTGKLQLQVPTKGITTHDSPFYVVQTYTDLHRFMGPDVGYNTAISGGNISEQQSRIKSWDSTGKFPD